MLVDAEDLLHDQDDRERSALVGQRPVRGNLAVADRDLHLARLEPLGIGRDRLGVDRLYRKSEARGQ